MKARCELVSSRRRVGLAAGLEGAAAASAPRRSSRSRRGPEIARACSTAHGDVDPGRAQDLGCERGRHRLAGGARDADGRPGPALEQEVAEARDARPPGAQALDTWGRCGRPDVEVGDLGVPRVGVEVGVRLQHDAEVAQLCDLARVVGACGGAGKPDLAGPPRRADGRARAHRDRTPRPGSRSDHRRFSGRRRRAEDRQIADRSCGGGVGDVGFLDVAADERGLASAATEV